MSHLFLTDDLPARPNTPNTAAGQWPYASTNNAERLSCTQMGQVDDLPQQTLMDPSSHADAFLVEMYCY